MHDVLAYASDLPPSRRNFYPLWAYVLEYWFPSAEGFEIMEDWNQSSFRAQQIPQSQRWEGSNDGILHRPKPSLAVFDVNSPTQPFLFVNIHNGMPVNDLSRIYAKMTLEESFETLRACSFCAGFKTLCVVSAVGARWSMILRDTDWLEGEAESGLDYVGELEEDVTSPESYRIMGYCFKEIKNNILRRRRERED
ncbi:hypothetical protein AN958_11600 [Leucoagaricus sp. SymC.cos]|nr:hypothetical protein AN958_11600 [Leucoagaricus sp. SymC.cos]